MKIDQSVKKKTNEYTCNSATITLTQCRCLTSIDEYHEVHPHLIRYGSVECRLYRNLKDVLGMGMSSANAGRLGSAHGDVNTLNAIPLVGIDYDNQCG
jgi:hypothetical protein